MLRGVIALVRRAQAPVLEWLVMNWATKRERRGTRTDVWRSPRWYRVWWRVRRRCRLPRVRPLDWLARRDLPPIAGGVEVLTLVVNGGKGSEAKNWSPEVVPKATSELLVPTGKELKWDTAGPAASITTEGTAKLNFTRKLELSGAGKTINLSSGTTVTISSTGGFETLAANGVTQEIVTSGVDLKVLILNGNNTAKLKLTESITASTEVVYKRGIVSLVSFEVSCGKFLSETSLTRELLMGSGKIKCTATSTELAPAFTLVPTGLTFKAETSTVELTGTEGWLSCAGATLTFNNLTFTSEKAHIGITSMTLATLTLNLSGTTRELIVGNGNAIIPTTLTTNASEAHPIKIASNTETAFKLKLPEQESEWIKLKKCTVETGVWFINHGTDEGGNSTVGTTVKFEGKGFHGTVTCGDSLTLTDSAARITSAARTAGDNATLTDAAARTTAVTRTAADSATVTDSAARTAASLRTTADSATVSDAAASRLSTTVRTTGDGATLTDSATRTTALARTAGDSATATDNATTGGGATRTAGDFLSLSGQAASTTLTARTAADSATTSDEAASSSSHSSSRTTSDTLTLTDSAVRTSSSGRTVSVVLTLTDGAAAEGESANRQGVIVTIASYPATIVTIASYPETVVDVISYP